MEKTSSMRKGFTMKPSAASSWCRVSEPAVAMSTGMSAVAGRDFSSRQASKPFRSLLVVHQDQVVPLRIGLLHRFPAVAEDVHLVAACL